MRPLRIFVAAALFAGPLTLGLFAQENLAQSVSAQIAVTDPQTAGRALSGWAERQGGYFVVRSLDRVTFRVPPASLPELRGELDSVAFQVLSYNPAARDLTSDLASVEAGIRSRSDAVDRIVQYLKSADVAGTLAFERELNGLVSEVESLEGRKRYLLDSVALARVDVGLSSAEREKPEDLPSSFDWINTLGLYRFLNSTGQGGP